MVRTVDYESRKRAVLAATINRYIKEAQPVASDALAEEFDLSSATIRNIFRELEEGGFITHPYTSGGRIPTDKGYRYYVDFLISQTELLEDQKERIGKEYRTESKSLEEILEKTSDLICAVTHYTSIVSLIDQEDRFFYRGISFILEQPEFQDYTKIRYLIRVIEEKRQLLNIINRDFKEKVKVYIAGELECLEIEDCSLAVSSYFVRKKPLGRIAVLGPMRMKYAQIIPALEYMSEVLTYTLDEI